MLLLHTGYYHRNRCRYESDIWFWLENRLSDYAGNPCILLPYKGGLFKGWKGYNHLYHRYDPCILRNTYCNRRSGCGSYGKGTGFTSVPGGITYYSSCLYQYKCSCYSRNLRNISWTWKEVEEGRPFQWCNACGCYHTYRNCCTYLRSNRTCGCNRT